ncbi:class I SAM-dependent methyltransferase [Neorhizobium sp. P12A]|uniref:class I SAM-dependent methyltransferase n=1 Tax=Neorhizobium sp. P12A TaxID=2268027 RepID=UPI0011EFAB4E|nr:class I SAM-dependent methyltransferase [Neorhizobium sp. P12A]
MQRYNLSDQKAKSWQRRAEVCVNFIEKDLRDRHLHRVDLADLGCGDEKLGGLLAARLPVVAYQGYDVLPQSSRVIAIDLDKQELPRRYDYITVLGVTEYLEDMRGFLRRMAMVGDRMVLSHVISDSGFYDQASRARLGWKNHLSRSELLSLLDASGWAPRDSYLDPDEGRVFLVLAEAAASKQN